MRFVFALLCLASSSMAQSITSPTVWTKAMSPITVSSTLNLYSTLTIEAGVEVRMPVSGKISFWARSAPVLIVRGTEAEPVVFRCLSGSWAGFNLPGVTTRRPVIRAENAIFGNLGAGQSVVSLQNGDVDFFNCQFAGVATIPAGNIGSGQPTNIGVGVSAIGAFENCTFAGFGRGVTLSPGLALMNCDFVNIPEAIRVAPGRSATVSALGL